MKGHRITCWIILFFLINTTTGICQTTITGIVKDSITGDPMPFVSVYFTGNKANSTTTDSKGSFQLRNTRNYNQVEINFIGYQTKTITVEKKKTNFSSILLSREKTLNDQKISEIKASFYADEEEAKALVRKVIENKQINRIENNNLYAFELYEKLSFSATELDPEIQNRKIFEKFDFLFEYIDTTEISNEKIITFSVRETISEEYREKHDKHQKSVVTAVRHDGVDKKIGSEKADAFLGEAMKQVNIFDNEINLLFRRFISPLSTYRALSFYKFHIADTLYYEQQPYIDLQFVPDNPMDLGFTGNIWIALDSTYAVRKAVLNIPRNINLNFVTQMSIIQEFDQLPEGWAKVRETSNIELSPFKLHYGLMAKIERSFKNYNTTAGTDIVFNANNEIIILDNAEIQPDSVWKNHRHIPLKKNELTVGKLSTEFEKYPLYDAVMWLSEIILSNYARTGKNRFTSKFDFGPVGSTISHNDIEGYRFRLGGRTTAIFNDRFFLKGYGAYGMKDHTFKYSGTLIYSFYKKKFHEYEYRKNALNLTYQYDIHIPGQTYLYTDPDNIFLSLKRGKNDKMAYIKNMEFWYEKEFPNGFYWKIWTKSKNEEAAGSLFFQKKDENNNIINVGHYNASEIGLTLRYAMNEKFYQGRDSRLILKRDGPVFTLTQSIGIKNYLKGDYDYHFTELAAQKRFWLSGYGHLNLIGKCGKVWGEVPFPLLILPNANQTYTIQPESYSMMNTLEFINDSYASIDASYFLDGWIFNRIPYINRLKLREVLSFKGLWGSLSDKNNPEYNSDLFVFPENSHKMGKEPYMEFSIGVENIFKILRIDYVRRLTYLNNEGIDKNGLRVTVDISF